jgi:phage baseplate assembly protein W
VNIDYPFHFAPDGRTAATSDQDHVRDMIEQFLFTSPGERVNRPEFGSALLQLVFAPNSVELASTLQFSVQACLVQWLGDVIEIRSLSVLSEDSTLAVDLAYSIKATGEERTERFVRGGL